MTEEDPTKRYSYKNILDFLNKKEIKKIMSTFKEEYNKYSKILETREEKFFLVEEDLPNLINAIPKI